MKNQIAQFIRPQAIVFDLGKVLLDFDFVKAARLLAAESRLSADEMLALINQSPLLHRYETGLMTTDEFYREVARLSGYRAESAQFHRHFGDIFSEVPLMIELNRQFRAAGFPTYIFSNTSRLAADHIRATYPFFSEFTDYIFSFEHGAMKPQARLYEVVEQRTGTAGQGILYFDDREENIEAGRRRGWQAWQHDRPEATIAALRQSGLIS